MERLERIPHPPEIMGGKACIRGLRVTVLHFCATRANELPL